MDEPLVLLSADDALRFDAFLAEAQITLSREEGSDLYCALEAVRIAHNGTLDRNKPPRAQIKRALAASNRLQTALSDRRAAISLTIPFGNRAPDNWGVDTGEAPPDMRYQRYDRLIDDLKDLADISRGLIDEWNDCTPLWDAPAIDRAIGMLGDIGVRRLGLKAEVKRVAGAPAGPIIEFIEAALRYLGLFTLPGREVIIKAYNRNRNARAKWDGL